MAGRWSVTRVGLDDRYFDAVPIDDRSGLGDRTSGYNINKCGNAVRWVTAISRVALPGTATDRGIWIKYVGKPLEAGRGWTATEVVCPGPLSAPECYFPADYSVKIANNETALLRRWSGRWRGCGGGCGR